MPELPDLTVYLDALERRVVGSQLERTQLFSPFLLRSVAPPLAAPVQRIVYAEHESNYCAACQTGGRLLADRALSRLLHDDWPKTLEELEERKETVRPGSGVRA